MADVPYGTLIPNVSWPGITSGVQRFQYDCVHGITPNAALVITNPLNSPPDGFGTLVWSDGKMGGALRDCKVKRMTASFSGSGYVWTMEILDRRWQWANGTFPNGGGRYNQIDPNGKLIPWTIRSPIELAQLCLQAMGETSFRIEGLPTGLSTNDAKGVTKYLETGQNYPLTAANPPVNWEGVPPAIALSELCDRYGCRVIFQPFQDRVLIARLGDGLALEPNGSLAQASLSVTAPETPISVGVYGAPSQYQMRLALEPVALEWDGKNHYVPLDLVSYAPTPATIAQKQIVDCTVAPSFDAASMNITISINGNDYTDNGIAALYQTLLRRQAGPNNGVVITNPSSTVIRVTGADTQPFSVQCRNFAGSTPRSRFDARIVQPCAFLAPDWTKAIPPTLPGIKSTDRLSLYEARQLAYKSVWRAFRVMDEDVQFAHANAASRILGIKTPYKPIIVPGYGKIRDRRQLTISGYKVEQVIPSPRLFDFRAAQGAVQQGTLGGGILPEYYNGIARNQTARVYGQYCRTIGSSVAWNTRGNVNTPPMSLLKVDFQVDPFSQVIIFNEPIYRIGDLGGQSAYLDPHLVLECAVTVRDPITWTEIRPSWVVPLIDGVGLPEFTTKEDVIVNVIGTYNTQTNQLTGITSNPEDADAPLRAQAYVNAMAAKYQTTASQQQKWNGIMKIDPDGVIQQVTFSIGPEGIFTQASTNSEFSTYLPSYSARRNRENLAANPDAVLANINDMTGLQKQIAGGIAGGMAAALGGGG